MDWDLWGPSYTQDSPESSFDIRKHEREPDFYFGCGADVIEEDALNEKSCIEVLHKLISKENLEIEELEEDLAILQSQLEWAEQNKLKEWFEICCKDLGEKTNFLELLIRNLKNENVQNECANDFQSPMHGEPPRRISEIVKALFRTCCQSKSEQPEDIAIKDAFSHGTGQSSDRESLSNFESGSSITDEIVEPSVTHSDISLNTSIIVKDFRSDAFSHATGQSDDEKDLNSLNLKNITTEEVIESNVSCIKISSTSSMKPNGKSMNHPVIVTAQEAGIFYTDNAITESPSELQGHVAKDIMAVQESRIPATDSTVSHLNLEGQIIKNEMQFNSTPDPMAVQEPRIPATDSTVNENLHLKLQGKIIKNEMQFSSMSDTMAVQEPRIPATNSTVNWNSHLKLQGQIIKNEMQFNPVDGHEPCVPPIADVISNSSSNSRGKDRQKPGSTCRNNNANNQKKTKKTDLPIPCGVQEPGVASNDNETSLRPPPKPQVKRRKSTKTSDMAKAKEPGETPTEFSTLQGAKIESTSKDDLRLSHSCVAQEAGVVGDNSYNLCLLSKPQPERSKSTILISRDSNRPGVASEYLTLQGDTIGKPQIKRRKSTKPSDIAKAKEPGETPTEFSTLQGGTIESTSKEDLHLSHSCVAQEASVVGDNSYNLCLLSNPPAERSKSTILPSRDSNGPGVASEYLTLQGDTIGKPQIKKRKSTKPSDMAKAKEPGETPTKFLTLQGGTMESTSKEDLHLSHSCVAQEAGVVGDNSHDLCLLSNPPEERSKSTILLSRDSNGPGVASEYLTLQGDTIERKSENGLEFCKSSAVQESCVASDYNHSELFLQSNPSAKKRKTDEKDLQLSKACSLSESHYEVTEPLPTNREDMMKLKLSVLKAHAKQRELKNLSGKKKADIVSLLLQAQVD